MQQEKIETMEIDRRRGMFREMICNEESLINRRLTWLLAMQAFLFTGLYYSMQSSHKDVAVVIFYAIAIIGYPISLMVLSSLMASVKAFKKINEGWEKIRPAGYDGPDIFGLAPEFPKDGLASIMPYMSAENSIAFAFTFFWLITLIFEAHGGAFPIPFVIFALSVFLVSTAGVIGFWLKDVKFRSAVLIWIIATLIFAKICFFVADGLNHNRDSHNKNNKAKTGISMDFLK